jgi:photosystem II stability/assembly factor-like uncharacterized protein
MALVVDPTNSNNIYAGFYDVGCLRSIDAGNTWQRMGPPLPYRECTALTVDPGAPSTIYAGSGGYDNYGNRVNQFVESTDSGETWVPIGNLTNISWITAIVIDTTSPVQSRTLFVSLYGSGIWKSTDGGSTWSAVNSGLNPANLYATSLVISPANKDILVAAFDSHRIGPTGGIYVTSDGGASWSLASASLCNVYTLAIDFKHPQIVFAAGDDGAPCIGGVFRSADGGATWAKTLFDDWARVVAVDPSNPLNVYAGTAQWQYFDTAHGHGFFLSTDGGFTWQPANAGLSNLGVLNIAIGPSTLYLASEGDGLFKAERWLRRFLPISLSGQP